MGWGTKEKNRICRRVRQIREEKFGEGRGALRAIAKDLGLPYTTYLGYEKNRVNTDFLKVFSKKFRVPLLWLLCAEEEEGEAKQALSPGIKTIGEIEPFIIFRDPYCIVTIQDDSMSYTITKGSFVVVKKLQPDEDPHNRLIAFREDRHIQVRRAVKRYGKLLGFPENPDFKKPTVIQPENIIGQAILHCRFLS